ncbi:Cubilin like protein [Argiope bruennichi]|uniref:Cubilin like protein n=1 Tax=Argiope bruennichi TaxID=94029 RepID=A0A8T0ENU2_ARGBR|nr:Cubilin like protein [Argiope bruennichi]
MNVSQIRFMNVSNIKTSYLTTVRLLPRRIQESWVVIRSLVCIVASDSDPADPYVNQPRIIVRDGALVIQGAFNKEVKFATSGQGQVKLNEVDLSSARGSGSISMASRLMSRLSSLSNRVTELSDQLNQMEENITTLAAKVNRFVGTGQDRISNRAVRRISSKVNQLQDKVNTLTQLLTENECNSNPCKNGGTCIDTYNGFICNCPPNWEGPTCESDINECARYAGTSLGCQNGATCINTQGGYTCNCPANWFGIHCTQQHDDCSTASHQELCGHGTCVDEKRALPGQPKYRCICDAGWQAGSSGPACTVDIDECNGPVRRCSTNPPVVCINLPGSFHCGPCPAGYTGSGHTCSDINECEMNNGGCSIQPYVQCINTIGSRTCGPCPSGYVGDGAHCSFIGVCNVNRGGCHPLATCVENTGKLYTVDVGSSFRCTCNFGFTGTLCDQEEIDMCATNPCQNDGVCSRTPNGFICNCQSGFEGPTCAQRTSSCGGEFVQDNGTLQFPETGITYDHMMSCEWVITVSNTKVVNLTFDYFDLEGGHNCEYDFLQINDGANSARMILNRFCGENLHGRSIVSTHNQVYLWFKSDKTVAHTGFKLNWTAQNPECGGELNISDYGSFNSPGYPGVYPNDRTCAWLVRVPVGKRIQFHFATLQLEVHSNCSYDYVKVYDGASDTDPVIGTYCTSVTPPPLTTSGHSALVVFHSDNSGQYGGFHITYSSQSNVQGCGGLLTTPTGRISSPNFPDVYENNLNCEWLIRIHPDNRLKVTFQEFNLEPHSNCSFDYLEIYSGNSDSAPLLGRYCGWNPPPELFSNTNQLFIRFRTDNSLVHSGFKAEYKTICGGVYSELTGILSSPYYPDSYPAHAQCIYDIRLDPGNLVNVSFHYMDIEAHLDCRYDYLEVRDGDSESSPLIGRICGYRQPENIISTYNSLWMRFETDGSVQNRGFYAEYNAIPIGCGGVFTEPRGFISTPRHPDRYPHSVTCSWHLKAPPGHIVRLTFSSFHLEPDADCQFDYVLVQDMDGTAIGKYCGNRKPPILTSMDSSLFVQFVSDASVARDGFTASYEFLDLKEACGGTYYRESGVIKSPGFPERYPHNAHCIWILKGKAQRQITLNATTFNLEEHNNCRYDYLEIRNGEYETSPLIGKFCGTNILQGIKSHSNVLRLEFKTDNSQSGAGFEIFYDATSTGCGGKLTAPRGSIVSPNYPQPYPYNADCEWLIQVSAGSIISLSIVDIDIEEHRDCRYDYVQVFDGPTENSRQVLRICNNQQSPGTITSSGNSLLIRFRSDFSEVAGGFHLAYQTLCNNNLTSRRGVIESPNFPDTYPHNHNCTWMIQAPPGSNISIAFSHLFLEGGDTCDADYVEVLQMDKEGHQSQLGKYCGDTNRPPGTIQTTTNTAIVRLVTDQSVTREGFRLEWAIKGCGGDIKNKNNFMITSPNYPNGYPMETTCYWHVSYPPGNRIELTIMDLDMEGVPGCHFDYLKVYGGEDRHAPQLLNICSTITAPRTITSHGNQMVVEFTSDASIGRRGFKATIKKTAGGCGGLYTTPEGTIMTPNFPETYNANDECDWLIEVDKSHRVILDFYDFGMPESVNGTKGYVAIYDGNSSTAPLLLKHWGPKPEDSILSTGHQMLVRLVADGNNVGNGFRAHYKTGCGGRLLADDEGVIQSPHYPDRDLSTPNCSWIIYTADPGERVNLIITHLYIPEMGQNCEFGSLFIYDGDQPDSPLNQQICGTRTPPPILSRGSMMHVFLTTGVFRATYGPASTQPCALAITTMDHSFNRTFNLEDSEHCNKDYVEIRENSESGRFIGRYCGNSLPSNLTDAPKLWIKFRSDDVDTQRGFLAHFELMNDPNMNMWHLHSILCGRLNNVTIVSPTNLMKLNFKTDDHASFKGFHSVAMSKCGSRLVGPTGVLKSEFIHSEFTEMGLFTSVNCEYVITVRSRRTIQLSFDRFNVPSDSICSTNYIMIKNGGSSSSPYLGNGKYCGSSLPANLETSSNELHVQVVINTIANGVPDFEMHYTELSVGCGGYLFLTEDRPNVEITSPNYPNPPVHDTECEWVVTSPAGTRMRMDFDNEFHMSPQCDGDGEVEYLQINDGGTDKAPPLHRFCHNDQPSSVMSTGNAIYARYVTAVENPQAGFKARVQIAVCGGTISTFQATITSPNYPNNYGNSQECVWYLKMKSHYHIYLTLTDLQTPRPPTGQNCTATDYLEIRNVDENGEILGVYCGALNAIQISVPASSAYVKFKTNSAQTDKGFSLSMRGNYEDGCGDYLEGQTGVITSPNYPNALAAARDCTWRISARERGGKVRLTFRRLTCPGRNFRDLFRELLITSIGRNYPKFGTAVVLTLNCQNSIP